MRNKLYAHSTVFKMYEQKWAIWIETMFEIYRTLWKWSVHRWHEPWATCFLSVARSRSFSLFLKFLSFKDAHTHTLFACHRTFHFPFLWRLLFYVLFNNFDLRFQMFSHYIFIVYSKCVCVLMPCGHSSKHFFNTFWIYISSMDCS